MNSDLQAAVAVLTFIAVASGLYVLTPPVPNGLDVVLAIFLCAFTCAVIVAIAIP